MRISNEVPSKRTRRDYDEEPEPSRRKALKIFGGAAIGAGLFAAGVNAIDSKPVSDFMDWVETHAKDLMRSANSPEAIERAREARERREAARRRSPRLEHGIEHADPLYRRDLALVLRRCDALQASGLPADEFIRTHIMAGIREEEVPAVIQEELKFFLPALFAVESRYDNEPSPNALTRESNAATRAQVVPSTRNDYGYTDAQMREFPIQVELVRRMTVDAYRMLLADENVADPMGWKGARDSLEIIKERYFSGNGREIKTEAEREQDFMQYFLVPALLTSYQAGIGSVKNFIQWAAQHPVDRNSASGPYEPFLALMEAAVALPDATRAQHDFFRLDARQSLPRFANMYSFAELIRDARNRVA